MILCSVFVRFLVGTPAVGWLVWSAWLQPYAQKKPPGRRPRRLVRFSCYPMPTGTTGTGSGGAWLPHARFQPLRFVVIEGRIASRHDLDGYWHDQTRIIGGDDPAGMIEKGSAVRWPVSRVLFRFPGDGYSSSAAVAGRVEQPTRTSAQDRACRARRRVSLHGLAPDGVYHARPVAGPAVRSYRTFSPLPPVPFPGGWRFVFCGTFPGVAPAGRYPAS